MQQGALPRPSTPGLLALSAGALGVVFGDIGTSPLYTLKTVLDLTGNTTEGTVLGVISLMVWTLIIVTSVKYAGFAMCFDNHGEGGILALLARLGGKAGKRPVLVAVGLLGAALIYGDGAITPAISVLSALEGLKLVAPGLGPYVLPLTIGVLIALFALQPLGTEKIGHAFGPIMGLWFVTMAALGVGGIVRHPGVLRALNPWHGIDYLMHSGGTGFLVLGGVFLCVTGAEALYADMGQFGKGPIKLAWSALVFPSLVLNYAGQGALLLANGPAEGNIFYRLCPGPFVLPLIILSTLATIIASQSIITGAFSMTRQAIQLGWMPHLRVRQTSAAGYGQIYVGAVNWLLMIVTVGLTLAFKKSDNLAGAYGIAVSATMILTTGLLFIAMREIWQWGRAASAAVAGLFMVVDAAFFTSNLAKLFEGGYVPLLLAAAVYGVMLVWHRGSAALVDRLSEGPVSYPTYMAQLERDGVARVPGTAVFLTRATTGVPAVVRWYVRHAHALHEKVVAVRIEIAATPVADAQARIGMESTAAGFWVVTATYGFMETIDLPALMTQLCAEGCAIDVENLTYFVALEQVIHRGDRAGLPGWMAVLFGAMLRNGTRVTELLRIPADRLVGLSKQVSL